LETNSAERKIMKINYSEQKTGKWMLISGLGWMLVFLLLFLYGMKHQSEAVFVSHAQKEDLLSRMRIHMLQSFDFEKAAVIAVTDKESDTFARQSLACSDYVDQDLREIDALSGPENEKELRKELSDCWNKCREVDKVLLDFAVQNTNLKAAYLSSTDSGSALHRFEQFMRNLAETSRDIRETSRIYQAVIALLKIQNLQPLHINEANDSRMSTIETEMKAEENIARTSLKALAGLTNPTERAFLEKAGQALEDFFKVHGEVIRLSRLNTNIKSVELSMGRKRKAAARCQEILNSMQDLVRSQSDYLLKGNWSKFR
jgi:hypothetical protein